MAYNKIPRRMHTYNEEIVQKLKKKGGVLKTGRFGVKALRKAKSATSPLSQPVSKFIFPTYIIYIIHFSFHVKT